MYTIIDMSMLCLPNETKLIQRSLSKRLRGCLLLLEDQIH